MRCDQPAVWPLVKNGNEKKDGEGGGGGGGGNGKGRLEVELGIGTMIYMKEQDELSAILCP